MKGERERGRGGRKENGIRKQRATTQKKAKCLLRKMNLL
jgi:hypothetical protein